jgi:hypothetical protein
MTAVCITGFEHGNQPSADGLGMFSAITGTSPSVQSTVKHSGTYALRVNPSNATSRVTKNIIGSQQTVVGRFYFRIDTAPGASCEIFSLAGSITTGPVFAFNQSTGKIAFYNGSTYTDGPSVVIGQWHRVDFRFVCSSNPNTMVWQVDGNAQTDGSISQASGVCTTVLLGTNTAVTCNFYIDDVCLTSTSGDYPLGAGGTELLVPSSDGSHNAGTNVMEDQAGNDVNGTTVTAYDKLNSVPFSSSTYIRQAANGTGNYVEVNFGDVAAPNRTAIIGAQVMLAYTSASTAGNNGGCICSVNGFVTPVTIWGSSSSPSDMSDGSLSAPWYKSIIPTAVISDATANALQARMGYSSDANPDPYWIDLWVEVAYKAPDSSGPAKGAFAKATHFVGPGGF